MGLDGLVQLLTDEENQPHQYVGDPKGLKRDLAQAIVQVLQEDARFVGMPIEMEIRQVGNDPPTVSWRDNEGTIHSCPLWGAWDIA